MAFFSFAAFVLGAAMYLAFPTFRASHAVIEIFVFWFWYSIAFSIVHIRETMYNTRDCRQTLLRDSVIGQIW